jgi:hypothetical protein
MLNVPAQLGVQASTDHQDVAVATAVYLTCVEIGGAVGSAISGAVWGKNIPTKLEQYLPTGAKGDAVAIYNNIQNALKYPVGTPERLAVDRAYQETMWILLIIAVCVAVPLSLIMRNYKLDTVQQHVKGGVIGRTAEDGREEDVAAKNGLGRWLQWPIMKKRLAPRQDNAVIAGLNQI